MAWKTLCNEVEFLTQHPEVGLAISDSTAPIPGYLFGEINAITYIDYGNNCKPLVNFLASRLEANTPLVCIKVLKLLLYLVNNGHAEMVEEVKFHEIKLKEAMGFHGPPDDLHGKRFYENIRKASKELLEYVFSEDKKRNENVAPPSQSELIGYGSSASSKNLQGFGYSVKSQKTVSEKVSDGITNFVEKLLPSTDKGTESSQGTHLSEALPQYKPLIINKRVLDCEVMETETRPSLVQMPPPTLRTKKKVSVYKPGRPGGGWDDSEDEDLEQDTVPEEIVQESCASVDSVDFSKIELKEVATDWIDEHKVVDEFTIDEELSKLDNTAILFHCKRCSSLNCDKVLNFLVEKFSNKVENVQLRALVFVEYLLFHDIITLESLLRIILPSVKELSCREEDIPNAVKIKARKVNLIIENLNKTCQQRQSKQLVGTPISCNS
ncbi:AP-4 complex accessory subunit Tepsin [Trichonephila inaurata madagascariensis]|uniref:AP-4 complex accessory subunit Tepsin n=1 Tax=Trichonephila inaurata madagascariensis TaxID=2747483 RepID=A0A8X7CRK9_9ARAC|nr:AP-4 complex accessory subunit Tepsin [Trichonephila inaurata madagascariensis]